MSHFPAPQWADLIRGLTPDDVRDSMENHLRERCHKCLDDYGTWQRVASFARSDDAFEPPTSAIRVVHSYMCWLPATLMFDSLQAAPAGVRAAFTASRHVLYVAGPWAIDIHLEASPKEGATLLTGQIGDSRHPDQPPKDLELALVSANRSIATFFTNEFGEFQCESEPDVDLMLVVSTKPESTAINLGSLFEPRNRNGSTQGGQPENR
jgi:hypothetical protein